MIDGAYIDHRPRRKRRVIRTFVEMSCPEETDFFPGPGSRARAKVEEEEPLFRPGLKAGAGVVPVTLSFSELSYAGYWRCHAPCYHIQKEDAGNRCGKCGRKTAWVQPVPK